MADDAGEPLIDARGEEDHDELRQQPLHHDPRGHIDLPEPGIRQPGLFVWLLTFSAGISGLLFGYDTGVISATLVSIGSSLSNRPLSTLDRSLITACTSLFALLICPISGQLADGLGRKKIILLADGLFILGAVIQAASSSVRLMIFGRSVVGLAVGAASFAVPLYIAELAPAKFRGRMVTLNVLFITLGQVLAYVIGWGLVESGGPSGWRWLLGLGALPATLQCLIMMLMPESPRWLIMTGRKTEAKLVIQKVFGAKSESEEMVQIIVKRIECEVRKEEEAKRSRSTRKPVNLRSSYVKNFNDSYWELFHVPGNRRALTIACLLQGLQQLCGFNSLMYFSATIFSLVGFSSPTLTSLSVAITNFMFTLVSLFLIDIVGRRRILLFSIPMMVFALASCGIAFRYVVMPPNTQFPNVAASHVAVAEVAGRAISSPQLILASVILYVAAYALGLGNVPWQQSELFPLYVRSLGSGLSTATNWGSNFVVGATFLPMVDLLSPSWTFLVYAIVCLIGWFLIWCVYPETNGLNLEETSELLKFGWGVEQSLRRIQEYDRVSSSTS